MQDIRCTECNKLLCQLTLPIEPGEAIYVPKGIEINKIEMTSKILEIKCPRCKTINTIVV